MRISLLFLTLTLSLFCTAQSYEIEGLRQQIKAHPQQDTARVNLLTQICNASPAIPAEEMEKYTAEALSLSRKLNYSLGEGFALACAARVTNINGNYDESLKLLKQSDSIAKKTGSLHLQFWVYLRYASYNRRNNLRLALSWSQKAEDVAHRLNNKNLIAIAQNLLSTIYSFLGDNVNAMDYCLKAIKTAEASADNYQLLQAWDNIGTIYSFIGEYEKSNSYYQKEMELIKQLGLENSALANLLNSIGENYRLQKKYTEAIDYYKQSSALLQSLETSIPISNLAECYMQIDSLSKGFQYAFQAMDLAKKTNRHEIDAWIVGILARGYLKKNMSDSALYFARQGLAIGTELGTMEDMRDNTKALADVYTQKKDYQNAYKYYTEYISYRDSMTNTEVINKTAVIEHGFEMEKKESQIAVLNQQKKLQQNFLISALIGLALILTTAVLLYRNNRQKQKANKQLQQSYSNVELLEEIGRKITASLSVEKIIGTVYANVNTLMDANVFGIGIYNDALKRIEFPSTYEKGQVLPPYFNSIDDENRFAPVCFNTGKEIIMGNLDEEYKKYLQQVPTPHQGDQPHSLIFIPLEAKEKKLGVITVQSFKKKAYTDYHLYMLRNISIYTAIALDNAAAYQELKSTQAQLIQSEKMASLGELTAGIAHEIQNPLNFVNNFSEINQEMIDELRMRNYELKIEDPEIKELLNDIKQNSEKINHHGKRADAIVKGMLQHSRISTGKKEPTDINALCDEFLRLAYHGMRAKDKNFNCEMKTDFDKSIGKINIVPQDIGRVILNLINNAFYACAERSRSTLNENEKLSANSYQPIAEIKTRKVNDTIEIRVIDNGNGIPEKIKEKIFQPFFTTKPTGTGTGLGLSLSYDIVKAHGGELKVKSEEGTGTDFVVKLPL